MRLDQDKKLSDGQPLPANPFPLGDIRDAYQRCLLLERSTGWHEFVGDLPPHPPFEDILNAFLPIVTARVLGHALVYAPNDDGRNALGRDILACAQDEPRLLADCGEARESLSLCLECGSRG